MTNGEKFKEVFGFDLKGTCRCSNEKYDLYCKESPKYNITDCTLWLNEEYKKMCKDTSEIFVKLINRVSIEACIHGADTGGSYSQNKEGLIKALEDIKIHYGLVEYDIGDICNDEGWYSYGFIKRNG